MKLYCDNAIAKVTEPIQDAVGKATKGKQQIAFLGQKQNKFERRLDDIEADQQDISIYKQTLDDGEKNSKVKHRHNRRNTISQSKSVLAHRKPHQYVALHMPEIF